ncbi:glutamate racemase [Methylocapsa sp. S129]|uniref:glutamate racemase n=1 Tax=Methylocapsa sp. S129 TaxID=1641869 RepID=UPI00131CB0CB|nr:glutamate racemase [Methylocapsa sp. S129]
MNRVGLRGPRVLVFDSGLGGLTVLTEVAKARPDASLVYAADDAAFPYGALGESELVARVASVMDSLVALHTPDLVVIACGTASTLVLGPLRARYPALPFVGTVPAIKPAAAISKSRLVSVLATTGTVARDYTQALVREHAGDCEVALVGSKHLARIAEDGMKGLAVDDAEIAREIAPCFVESGGRRTDVVALACTHYPLLRAQFERLAPWPVDYVDPAPAIARRVDALLGPAAGAPFPHGASAPAIFTSGAAPGDALREALLKFGLVAAPTDAAAFEFSRT